MSVTEDMIVTFEQPEIAEVAIEESLMEATIIATVDNIMARVFGKAVTELPQDLYIPPDALRIFLEAFEGPLDLLLYLIRKHNLDILDIPIAEVTRQYMNYVDLMKEMHLELAGEYLLMAATLAEIKSRMLLPRPPALEESEEDPRAQLVRQLQLYEQFRQAALDLDKVPRLERDTFSVHAQIPEWEMVKVLPQVNLKDLVHALQSALTRAEQLSQYAVSRETFSVREAMVHVLRTVNRESFTPFTDIFMPDIDRLGVIVTFLAILELVKEAIIELTQDQNFGPIYMRAIHHD